MFDRYAHLLLILLGLGGLGLGSAASASPLPLGAAIASETAIASHPPDAAAPRAAAPPLADPPGVERSGVEHSGVERSGAEGSGAESSRARGLEARGSEAKGSAPPDTLAVVGPDAALGTEAYLTVASALAPLPSPATGDGGSGGDPPPDLPRPEGGESALPSPPAIAPRQAQADPDAAQDPELGVIQVRGLAEDNDLGILRIRQQPDLPTLAAAPPPKVGFLTARLAIASSDNVLLAVNDVGGITGDTFLRPTLGFGLYPLLGPRTALIATADLGLQRYIGQSSLNYDDLRFRVGVRQGLTPRSYAQLTFTYQELFRPGGNRNRFFKNTALGLTLGRRDPITPQLALDSYYLVQFNGAQALSQGTGGAVSTDFSRILQSAGAYLGYDIAPQLQTGISYQISLFDYTAQERYDTFQQVLGQLVYRIAPTVRLSLYGGISFGRSSEPRVRFDDTFFGVAIDANVPLF